MSMVKQLSEGFDEACAGRLHAGDAVSFTGVVYTARDAAHARLVAALKAGKEPPFDLRGAVIYYAGPAPARPGSVMGPCGPTSSYRMDPYAPMLYDAGVRATIGKGVRGSEVVEAVKRNRAVYLVAVGGVAALMARCVKSAETIAYEDLGCEAVRRLEVVDMPLVVALDTTGTDVYRQGPASYQASLYPNLSRLLD